MLCGSLGHRNCGRALALNLEKVSCDCAETAINKFSLLDSG